MRESEVSSRNSSSTVRHLQRDRHSDSGKNEEDSDGFMTNQWESEDSSSGTVAAAAQCDICSVTDIQTVVK